MANEFKIKKGLIVTGASGGTVVDIQGSQGQLFSVTDDLSGSIFAVSDISGVPIFDVNSSGLSTFDGSVGIGLTSTTANLEVKSIQDSSFDEGIGVVRSNTSQTGYINMVGGAMNINAPNAIPIKFRDGGNTNLTISGDGHATFAGTINSGSITSTGIITAATTFKTDSGSMLFFVPNVGQAFEIAQNTGDATFAAQAFSTATSSGDASSTLTTKGYVDGLITGATIYRGAWDPSGGGYGSPDLSTVTQTSGYYYICSAAGTAEPNGTGTEPDTWETGDWVIYNDVSGTGQWQKIDNSSVLSGAGTGQTVALWEGAGSVTDSETLGNAPITVSGNDTTFAGNISVIKSSASIKAEESGGADMRMVAGGSTGYIGTYSNDAVHIQQNSGAAITIDTSRNSTFAGDLYIPGFIYHVGDTNTYFGFGAPDVFDLAVGGSRKLYADSAALYLYYSGSQKLRTTNIGATVTGQLTVTNGIEMIAGNFNAGDGERIRLGNSADLQIYHDGSHSYINDSGTGALKILASQLEINNAANTENIATFTQDGAVSLFYNNVKKLETTNTGVTVTGSTIIENTSAVTNDSVNVLDIKSLSSGTTANGFGVGLGFFTENSTYSTVNEIGRIEVVETSEVNLNDKMIFYVKDNNTLAERLSITGVGATFAGSLSVKGQTFVDNANTNYDISMPNGIAFGGAAYTYCNIFGDSGNMTIAANAYPANEGVASTITFKTATSAGGSITPMVINGGNVGIGTTSPLNRLHVKGSDQVLANFESTTNKAAISVKDDDTTAYISAENGRIGFGTAGQLSASNLTMLTSNNNVGIGSTTPQSKLQVAGGIQMADDTDTASAAKVGTMRYRTGTEYVEVDGVELVTNGDFATDTDWAKTSAAWTISGGSANASNSVSYSRITQAGAPITTTTLYRLIFTVSVTSGTVVPIVGSQLGSQVSASGTYTQYLTSTATTTLVQIASNPIFTGSIDNVSIMEVTAEDASYADMCMQTGASTYEWVNIVRNTY